jgi:plastocyanin
MSKFTSGDSIGKRRGKSWARLASRAVTAAALSALAVTGCLEGGFGGPDNGEGETGGPGGGGGGDAVNTTWLNANNWTIGLNGRASSYTVSDMITVPNEKTLVIRPGTTITFTTNNAGIRVNNGGTILAEGTATSRIALKGSALKWSGIQINSPTANVLDYVDILNAGYGTSIWNSAIYLYNGKASVTNCVIDGSASNGVSTEGSSGEFIAFANNAVKNSEKAAMFAYSNVWSYRNISADNTFSANASNFIQVNQPGSITSNMTLKKMPIPWRFYGSALNVEQEATLTVEAGTTIEFAAANGGIYVTANASVVMAGDKDNRITLKGTASNIVWKGIEIRSDRIENTFDYVDILNGGSGSSLWNAALYLYNGSASVTNCIIDSSASSGVCTEGSGYLRAFANNIVRNCERNPIYTYSTLYSLRNLGEGNAFTGNAANRVHVRTNSGIERTMTLKKLDIPYYLENGLNIDNDVFTPTFTIEPGTQIWVNGEKEIYVGDYSNLVAVGTPEDRILFRGSSDQAGWWRGIRVDTDAEGTKFAYVDISGGGSASGWSGNRNLYLYNGTIELLNVRLSKSDYYCMGFEGNNNKIWSSGVTFEGCAAGNVWTYPSGPAVDDLPENNFTPSNPLL